MMLHHEYKDLLGSRNGSKKRGKKDDITLYTEFPSFPKKLFYFLSSGEKALQKLIKSGKSPTAEQWTVDDIKNIVTAKNLCSCTDPITTAFDVRFFNLTA